jgi:hypothetical protein
MRALLTTTILLAAAATAHAGESSPRLTADRKEPRTLSADELGTYAATYYPAVRACYITNGRPPRGATGELSVQLVVHRDGYVRDVAVTAPGVRGRLLRKLQDCIRSEALSWHFPVRRAFTTAILPYYFLALDVPGAGPQYSCWNPRGCPAKPARPARLRRPNS